MVEEVCPIHSRAEILVNHMYHPGLPSAEAVAKEAAISKAGHHVALEKKPLPWKTSPWLHHPLLHLSHYNKGQKNHRADIQVETN